MRENHFLYYMARMQDRGFSDFRLKLGVDKDSNRVMTVTPLPIETYVYLDTIVSRTFMVNGGDPQLAQIEDDLIYSDAGMTREAVDTQICLHPEYKTDLNEFFDEWKKSDIDDILDNMPEPTPEELAEAERSHKDTMRFVKGVMAGLDGARGNKRAKA